MSIISQIFEARINFFRRYRSENAQLYFLQNERRLIDLFDTFSLANSITRLVTAGVVGGNTTTFNVPLPPNWGEPVTVAPTVAQRDAAFIEHHAEGNCPICQEQYRQEDAIIRLRNCSHSFHRQCANTWYSTSVHCPLCRDDIRVSATS